MGMKGKDCQRGYTDGSNRWKSLAYWIGHIALWMYIDDCWNYEPFLKGKEGVLGREPLFRAGLDIIMI